MAGTFHREQGIESQKTNPDLKAMRKAGLL